MQIKGFEVARQVIVDPGIRRFLTKMHIMPPMRGCRDRLLFRRLGGSFQGKDPQGHDNYPASVLLPE